MHKLSCSGVLRASFLSFAVILLFKHAGRGEWRIAFSCRAGTSLKRQQGERYHSSRDYAHLGFQENIGCAETRTERTVLSAVDFIRPSDAAAERCFARPAPRSDTLFLTVGVVSIVKTSLLAAAVRTVDVDANDVQWRVASWDKCEIPHRACACHVASFIMSAAPEFFRGRRAMK